VEKACQCRLYTKNEGFWDFRKWFDFFNFEQGSKASGRSLGVYLSIIFGFIRRLLTLGL
jgi:hypothetical protein